MRQRPLYPTSRSLPFHAHSPPPSVLSSSLCRNGKMECVPEEKGNLPALLLPPVPVPIPVLSINKALEPFALCSLFPTTYSHLRLNWSSGRFHFVESCSCTLQRQTAERLGSAPKGKCTTAVPSRAEAWPARQPAVT